MLAAAWSCASLPGSREPRIDVAGVPLPGRIGPYVASLVEYSGDPRQGAFVRYVAGDSTDVLPRIDVIVYPADGHELPEEIELTHGDLLEADRTSPVIDQTTLLEEARFDVGGRPLGYRAAYHIAVRDVPQRSLLYLQGRGGRFVKARASFPLHAGFDPTGRIDQVVAELFAGAAERR